MLFVMLCNGVPSFYDDVACFGMLCHALYSCSCYVLMVDRSGFVKAAAGVVDAMVELMYVVQTVGCWARVAAL